MLSAGLLLMNADIGDKIEITDDILFPTKKYKGIVIDENQLTAEDLTKWKKEDVTRNGKAIRLTSAFYNGNLACRLLNSDARIIGRKEKAVIVNGVAYI